MGKLQSLLSTIGRANMRDPMLVIGMTWFRFQLFRLHILFLLFLFPLCKILPFQPSTFHRHIKI